METKQTKNSTTIIKVRGKSGRPKKQYWYPYESAINAYKRKLKCLEKKIKKVEHEQRVVDSLGVEILEKDLLNLRRLQGKAGSLIDKIEQYEENQKMWKTFYPYEYAKYTFQKEATMRQRKHRKALKLRKEGKNVNNLY